MDRQDADAHGIKTGNSAIVRNTTRRASVSNISNQQRRNGSARELAQQAIADMHGHAVSVIDYVSKGRLVIFADIQRSRSAIRKIVELQRHGLRVEAIIDSSSGETTFDGMDIPVVCGHIAEVRGHLGCFDVTIRSAAGRLMPLTELLRDPQQGIDIVVDLLESPCHDAQIPPPGYLYGGQGNTSDAGAEQGSSADKLIAVLESLPDMVGEFDKPRYFSYNPTICVHGRAGKTACTRCIDACPTLAITSLGESVTVDPYLCQGGGSCAATCPSGAMAYDYPSLDHVLTTLRTLLQTYRSHHGTNPRILFYGGEAHDQVQRVAADPACHNTLPLMMEDVGAIGMETTLAALAYGAQQVIVLTGQHTPQRVWLTLQEQTAWANQFLDAMGYAGQAVVLCHASHIGSVLEGSVPTITTGQRGPARFMPLKDKRAMTYRALEHLNQIAPDPQQSLAMPQQAPFGRVHVNQERCTLCMACASVCPVQALQAGGERPRLDFIEDNCVQCGLCQQSCPEQAVSLEPRFVFSATRRKQARVLNEDVPFNCIRCGKPFTTRRMVDHMNEKLAGHWMFQDEGALSRLKMCDNCRVADMLVSHEKMH